MYQFQVPERMKLRVIIDTDAKNEADDQFAVVHALLTPRFKIKGIIGAHFGRQRTENSMEESYNECVKVLKLMDMAGKVDVLRGARGAINNKVYYEYSEGAQRIVDEALSDDPSPLFIVFLGPLTDLACAYLHSPEIAGKFTAIWIGGNTYPDGGAEFNLGNDLFAANTIMKSGIELWQVPCNVYATMRTSFAELQDKVWPYGKIGRYLFEQMVEFNHYAATLDIDGFGGESWTLGDSPVIGLMLNPHECHYTIREAPYIDNQMKYHFDGNGRAVRVYDSIDSRFILEDMFAKLKINYARHIPAKTLESSYVETDAAQLASGDSDTKTDAGTAALEAISEGVAEYLLEGYAPMEGLNQDAPHILSIEEFSDPSPHIRVSGLFGEGSVPQFNIYLPPKEQWKGRFFQRAHPFLGLDVPVEDLKFYLASGVYTITVPLNTIGHVTHASAAHVSRTIAKNYYGYDKKIYGYLYGGSGGSMQTIGALEAVTGLVWDGAVPFIVASPTSLANFDIRWFARAILEGKAELIADAVRPGGSGDPYAELNELERDILREVTELGLPLRAWENYEYLFMMHEYSNLIEGLNATGEVNASYTNAFWNELGYLEAYDSRLRNIFYDLKARGVSEGALAKIAYHRHKDPGPTFYTWNHLRDANGDPLYAQTPGIHYAIETASMTSGGAQWNGEINYKTIAVVNLVDQDSFPTDGDYYRERVKAMGREDNFRIWLNENADHHDSHDGNFPYLDNRLINYSGILQQALIDLSAWVEDDTEPPNSTSYLVADGQLVVSEDIAVRGGIQPVVKLTVDGAGRANIAVGGSVNLSASIHVPQGTGVIVGVEWDFLGDGGFAGAAFGVLPDGSWMANASYDYNEAGVYFPRVRVVSQREGDSSTPFARAYNYGCVRVIVGGENDTHE